MLPLKYIRQNAETVRQGMLQKGVDAADLDRIIELDEKLRAVIVEAETLKAERNRVTQDIAVLKKAGESAEDKIAAMGQLGKQIKELDANIQELQDKIQDHLLWIPNLPHESVPTGTDATQNKVVKVVGEAEKQAPNGKDHLELLSVLKLVDFQAVYLSET